jgi:hypothetical protein
LIPLIEYEAVREIVEDERRQRTIRAVGLRNAGRRAEKVPCVPPGRGAKVLLDLFSPG